MRCATSDGGEVVRVFRTWLDKGRGESGGGQVNIGEAVYNPNTGLYDVFLKGNLSETELDKLDEYLMKYLQVAGRLPLAFRK